MFRHAEDPIHTDFSESTTDSDPIEDGEGQPLEGAQPAPPDEHHQHLETAPAGSPEELAEADMERESSVRVECSIH